MRSLVRQKEITRVIRTPSEIWDTQIKKTTNKNDRLRFTGSTKFGRRFAEVSVEHTYSQIRNRGWTSFLVSFRCFVLYGGMAPIGELFRVPCNFWCT